MSLRRYLQLDVFAHRIGAGNPLAVVFDAQGLDDAAMQSFAAWMHLPETVFLLPPEPGADYRARIFTPVRELDFAGHPSVGAAWAVLDAGRVAAGRETMVQQCAAGLLPVQVAHDATGPRVSIRTPRAAPVALEADAAGLAAALRGLPPGALRPALWDNGARWWLAEVADARALREWRPDLAAIAALRGDALGLALFAPGDVAGCARTVRAFCPADGFAEDPVTGSANAAIASALLADGRLRAGDSYGASQGREVGRDGRVELRIDGDGAVWIGGQVQPVIRGSVEW
ncbi:PhzF family phenazine biosynthesis protein [Lysobacter enzymogenes]|uniref:PhzF family phenazine biosynthesis protein n=1 Tax=Lysobacter enzymogenes TaxID=69 RepID=UPI00384ECECC